MPTRLLWLFLFPLSACAMLPPPGKIVMSNFGFVVRDIKLPNGMRVIVEEDHGSDKAAVVAIVGVGSSSDPVGKEGMAHFLEHLAYRTRPDNRLTTSQMFDFAGASSFNAGTWLDDTTFHVLGPKESLPALLAILGSQLVGPAASVTPEAFEVERAVVRNELRLKTETGVQGQVLNWMQEAAFPPGHRYARPTGGTLESLNAITAADVQAFSAKHYRPENITLVIIGDLDSKALEPLLRALPPALTEGPPPSQTFFKGRAQHAAAEPPLTPPTGLVRRKSGAITDPEIDIVWTLPSSWTSDAAVQSFVADAMDNAITRGAWRDDDIRFVQASLLPGVEATLLHARVGLKTGQHPEKSLEQVLDQLVQMWSGGSSIYMSASRMEAMMSAAFVAEDIVARGTQRAAATHYLGDPAMFVRRMTDISKIDGSKVISFAEKYVTRERARAFYLEPLPEAERESVFGATASMGMAKDSNPSVVYPREEILKLARQPSLSDSSRFTLENGLEVLIVRRTNLPLVTLALGLKGGTYDANPLGAAEVSSWLASPTNTIHGYLTSWGARSWSALNEHSQVIGYRGPNGNLPNLLAVLSDRLDSMDVSRGAVLHFRDRNLDWLAEQEQRTRARVGRKIRSALYPSHRFGETATSEQLGSISEGDLDHWLGSVYQPQGARLVIVGDVGLVNTEQLVRSWLSGWSGGSTLPPADVPPMPKGSVVEIGSRPGATQTEVVLSCRLPDAIGKARVANDLLASLLQVRLTDMLRLQLGAAYGVDVRASDGVGGNARLDISTAIGVEDQPRAFDFLQKTWTGLGTDGWDLNEIDRARWELARKASLWGRTPSGLARMLVNSWMDGIDPSEHEAYPQQLVALTDLELEEAWNTCKASTVLAVLGDYGPASAALSKAGWTHAPVKAP